MSKIIRVFHTIRYLKIIQIIYQIKYRIFKYSAPNIVYKKVFRLEPLFIMIPELDYWEGYICRFHTESLIKNEINILGHIEVWQPGKWNFETATHLWNFNLHYFEYGVALACSYKKNNDLVLYKKFKELYCDWCDTNDYCKGDAWHPYTISVRIPNLLISMELFTDILCEDVEFYQFLNKSIYEQYIFLLNNMEKNLLANHYMENLKTLYICSVYFKENEIEKKIKKKFIGQLDEQILADGMHFERSFMYHRIILESLLRIYKIEKRRETKDKIFLENIKNIVERMADCMYSLEKGMGKIPLFNDAGEGVAKDVEQLLEAVDVVCDYRPKYRDNFGQTGYFKLHNKYCTILFDGGKMGPSYMLGHAHCDTLSFELSIEEIPVFVNAGTFQYQCLERGYFRSVRAHNTIQCGSMEQAECWGEHRVGRRIEKVYGCLKDKNRCEGSYVGYHGEVVKREITVSEKTVLLKDTIENTNEKTIHSFFHIHPACNVELCGDCIQISIPHSNKKVVFTSQKGKIIVHRNDELAQYSERFGEKQFGTTLEVIHNLEKYTSKIQII